MNGFVQLLAFDTDDKEFARGFEAGRLWALARSEADELEETIRTTNSEMMLRIAEATGRPFSGESVGETWLLVRFGGVVPSGLD